MSATREKTWEVVLDGEGGATLAMRPPLPFLPDEIRLVAATKPSMEISGAGSRVRLDLDDLDPDTAEGLRALTQVRLMEFEFGSGNCCRDILIDLSA